MIDFFAKDHSVKISPSSIVFTVFFLLSLFLLYQVRSVLVMIFLAVIIMAAFNPGVSKLHRKFKVPRVGGILLLYSIFIAFLVLVVTFVFPPLINQLQLMTKSINFEPIQKYVIEFKFSLVEINNLVDSFGGSVNTVLSVVSSTFSGLFTAFTVFVMSFYMLLERESLYKKVSWFSKEKKALKLTKEFIDSVELQLGGWIRGQLILMFLIGFVTYIGLVLLQVPYALPLALLAGLLEILPNIGPTLAAIPALIIAYIYGGFILVGVALLFYILIQQVENYVIVPKIMKDNVDVDPLVTIVTIIVGLQLGNVMGAVLAVPTYIIIRTLYGMWLRERR